MRDFAIARWHSGVSPEAIASLLSETAERFGLTETPAESTVKLWTRGRERRAKEETWRLADALPDEAAAILPVLASVHLRTRGAIRSFTPDEALWIARLRRMSGDRIPAWTAYAIAVAYGRDREFVGDPSSIDEARRLSRDEGLDLYLAFAAASGWTEPGAEYVSAAQAAGLPVISFGPWEDPS